MSSSPTPLPTPEGPGSVSGAPNLAAGFTDTFTSRYVDTGDAAPARGHRGRGAAAAAGPRLARDLVRVAPADAGPGPGLPGHRGRPARHGAVRQARGRVRHRHPRRRPGRADGRARPRAVRRGRPRHRVRDRLRARRRPPGPDRPRRPRRDPRIPGAAPSPPVFVPGPINDRLWHLPFNRLEKINEQLVAGREDIFFGWEFDAAAKKLPDEVIDYYVGLLSDPDALRGSFGFYRALDTTIAQDGRAQDPAADHARPGDRRSGELRRARRGGDEARRGRRAELRHPRRRPLRRRGGPRRDAGGADARSWPRTATERPSRTAPGRSPPHEVGGGPARARRGLRSPWRSEGAGERRR